MRESNIDGDVCIVTGASGGLGRELALRFSQEGARVALMARTESKLREVADEAPGETLVLPSDLRDADAVEDAIEQTVETFGGIDTLVNNAGVGQLSLRDQPQRIHNVSVDDWQTILRTNLTGVFLLCRAVLPHMLAAGSGNVMNVTSGLSKQIVPGWGPYTSSKHGLKGLTKTLAVEYDGDGINANLLYPGGLVDTGFWDHLSETDDAQLLPPDVMNDAAVLLADQRPNGITGKSMQASSWEHTFLFVENSQ
jgi:3-oxoacyl-[acyl-carrier protein] reductase